MASTAFLPEMKPGKKSLCSSDASSQGLAKKSGNETSVKQSSSSRSASISPSAQRPLQGEPKDRASRSSRSSSTSPSAQKPLQGEPKARTASAVRRSGSSLHDNYASISDFTFKSELGQGAFGHVFKARCNATGRLVAVKTLKNQDSFKDKVNPEDMAEFYKTIQDSFKAEIKFMETAGSHPNVVTMFGKTRDHKSSITELACCDLFHLVRASRRKLPLDCIHHISNGLIAGVAHLHNLGIVHQDLKSNNILLDQDGTPKICDFGLAVSLRKDLSLEVNQELVTLWYRPPELLLGCDKYTSMVDNWAVGCVIFEMILGDVAFPGDPVKRCYCKHRRHLNFNADQLGKIFQTVGTPELSAKKHACFAHIEEWPKYPSRLEEFVKISIKRRAQSTSSRGITSGDDRHSIQAWTDLLEDLLNCDPDQRLSCAEALSLPLFRGSAVKAAHEAVSRTTSAIKPSSKAAGLRSSGSAEASHPSNAKELLEHLLVKYAPGARKGEAQKVEKVETGMRFPQIAKSESGGAEGSAQRPVLEIGDIQRHTLLVT